MKKSLLIIPITVIILVIAYLAYDLLKPKINPCEGIFQQTSLRMGSKLEIIKAKGEVFIGSEKIQDLTERSQMTALNLKTCCIGFDNNKLTAEEFLRCKENVAHYETKIEKLVTYINEAQVAKERGKADIYNEKVRQINDIIAELQDSKPSIEETPEVTTGETPEETIGQTTKETTGQTTEETVGETTFAVGYLDFKWLGGDCWNIYRGNEFVMFHCGAVQQPLQAGTYTITPRRDLVFKPFNVTIVGGSITTIEIAGVLEFKWPGGDCWDIYRGSEFVAFHCGTARRALQEGTYTIKPKYAQVFSPFNVTIQKGYMTTKP